MLMMMSEGLTQTDGELLGQFAHTRNEEAFRLLMRRHYGMVRRAAERSLSQDADQADDVCQTVFLLLARKSAALSQHEHIAAWLYRTTNMVVMHVKRGNARRRQRESAAVAEKKNMNRESDDRLAIDLL